MARRENNPLLQCENNPIYKKLIHRNIYFLNLAFRRSLAAAVRSLGEAEKCFYDILNTPNELNWAKRVCDLNDEILNTKEK